MRETDLADELFGQPGKTALPAGVRVATARQGGVTITRVEIAREGLARPRGRYVTLEVPSVSLLDERDSAVIEAAAAELRPLLKGYEGRVCTIDAGKISEEELGKNFPNTPMLAAIVKVSGVVEPDEFVKDMEASFKHKFASKPQVIEGNMRALKRSLEEVQVG